MNVYLDVWLSCVLLGMVKLANNSFGYPNKAKIQDGIAKQVDWIFIQFERINNLIGFGSLSIGG